MPVANPPTPLRPLTPEESRLFDIYVESESNFLAFRDAAGLSSSEALDFLRSIPEHLEALEAEMSSSWNRFTISRKTNVIRVLEKVIAENRDNPVERRRAACAILRAIDPPRQRSTDPAATRFTPSPVQPDRVPPTPPRQRPRDPVSEAIIARASLETLRAKIEAVQYQHDQQPASPQRHADHRTPTRETHSQTPIPPRSHVATPRHDTKAHDSIAHTAHPAPPRNAHDSTAPITAANTPAMNSASLISLAGSAPRCRDPAA